MRLRDLAKKALRSRESINVAKLTSGNAMSMAIPFLAAPVLSRIYEPADYGHLSYLMAACGILGCFATLEVHQAIFAEKDPEEASATAWTALVIGATLSAAVLGVVGATMAATDLLAGPRAWAAVAPLALSATAAQATAERLANLDRRYTSIAVLRTSRVLLSTTLAIAVGLRVSGSTGLLVAYSFSQAVSLLASIWLLKTSSTLRACPPVSTLRATLRRHRQFAACGLPTNFIERWAEQLPILAFAQLGAPDSSGSFNRARMLVTSPITLAISSVSSVYQERASRVFHRTGSCQTEARQTTALLALAGLPVLVIGMILCRPFIDFFLGPDWGDAGTFALILAPMLYVRAVVAPISTAYGFARQQKLDLFVTGLPVGLSSVAFLLLVLTEHPPIFAVYLYSASYTLVHTIQGIGAFRISGSSTS